ncbi:MAG TPA: TetR/AcrR family transcriptional regulator [Candidatus Binataceae bacterium]|nr:TetR/AcrR family transcriptional regulator [Candidatus Binataceae bacterium]
MSKVIPKRRRARPLEPAERRALLLQCAIRVFARRGLGGARHGEIAREAKVSVPTVFFYFPSHQALVRDVLSEVARFFLAMTERIHDDARPAPEIVLEHGRVFADAMVTHPDYARVMLEWSTALREEVWPLYLRFHEQNIRIIAATIRRWRRETGRDHDEDAEDSARVIAATGYVVAQMKVAGMPSEKIEHFLQTLVRDMLGDANADQLPAARTGTHN